MIEYAQVSRDVDVNKAARMEMGLSIERQKNLLRTAGLDEVVAKCVAEVAKKTEHLQQSEQSGFVWA